METRIVETAQRIKGLRELLEISPADMARATGLTEEAYLKHENGECDCTFRTIPS